MLILFIYALTQDSRALGLYLQQLSSGSKCTTCCLQSSRSTPRQNETLTSTTAEQNHKNIRCTSLRVQPDRHSLRNWRRLSELVQRESRWSSAKLASKKVILSWSQAMAGRKRLAHWASQSLALWLSGMLHQNLGCSPLQKQSQQQVMLGSFQVFAHSSNRSIRLPKPLGYFLTIDIYPHCTFLTRRII